MVDDKNDGHYSKSVVRKICIDEADVENHMHTKIKPINVLFCIIIWLQFVSFITKVEESEF